jgi:hypothetical protein
MRGRRRPGRGVTGRAGPTAAGHCTSAAGHMQRKNAAGCPCCPCSRRRPDEPSGAAGGRRAPPRAGAARPSQAPPVGRQIPRPVARPTAPRRPARRARSGAADAASPSRRPFRACRVGGLPADASDSAVRGARLRVESCLAGRRPARGGAPPGGRPGGRHDAAADPGSGLSPGPNY